MKISDSRKNLASIMANPHFGGIILRKGDIKMEIPPEWINVDGSIKGFALKLWKEKLAKAEAEKKKVI